jgi:hypothetical protein
VKGVIQLNQSKLTFIKSTLPNLLSWERRRSSSFIPGTVKFPERPGRFALALTRCMRDEIDLVPHVEGNIPCWIGNRAQFIGKPIKPNGSLDRINRYYQALHGKAGYFMKKNDYKPADAARHMLNYTKGFCVVRKLRMPGCIEEVWSGDCPDCMKNLGFECPVATKVRENIGYFKYYDFGDLMLSQVEPSERSVGPQDAKGLKGLGPGRRMKRRKNPGTWTDDPKKFWRSYKDRSDKQFHDICSFFGIEKWEKNEKGKLVKIRLTNAQLLDGLVCFELCPTCSRGISHAWDCKVKDKACVSYDVPTTERPTKKIKYV